MPPIVVPWPPRYLVTEWMTMSAPCSNGRQRYGEASVLSMTSGMPAPCAIVRERRDVADVELRIADRLGVDRLGVGLERGAKRFGIVGVDERRVDAELRERDRELRIRAAVERARGDDVVAVSREREQREHLRRHAGGRGERRAAAFERGDALLERRDRRIRDARVDVAEGLQVEQARRVVGASRTRTTSSGRSAARARRSPRPESGPRAGRACRSRICGRACARPVSARRSAASPR